MHASLKSVAVCCRDAVEGLDFLLQGGWGNRDPAYRRLRVRHGLRAFRNAWWIQYRLEEYRSFRRAALQVDWALRQDNDRGGPVDLPADARVVIVRFGHLGDQLHLAPTVREMRRQRPGWRIELVTGPWNKTLIPRLGLFDDVHYLTPDLVQFHRGRRDGVLSRGEERDRIRTIRGRGVDMVFCPSNPQLAELPLVLALAPSLYVGFKASIENIAIPGACRVQPFDSRHYEMDAVADFLPAMGLERPVVRLGYRPADEARGRVSAWLREQEITAPFVAVFPGSGWAGKCWPADRFAVAVGHLQDRGLGVVLAGSPDERSLCETIRVGSGGRAAVAAGPFSIDESAALIEQATLVLGNDSAPIHFAAAMDVPSVSLWGPTFVEKWGPRGPRHRCIRNVDACPCIYWHPRASCERDGACMKAIGVEQVMKAVESLLTHAGPVRVEGPR